MDALATLVVYARPFTDLSQSTKIHEYIQLLCEEESWKICPNMETNILTIAPNRNAQNIISAKSQKVLPLKKKQLQKKQAISLGFFFDVQSFCMINFPQSLLIC